MRIFLNFILLLIIALIPSLLATSCQNEDDIDAIFNGKTWFITGGCINGTNITGEELKSIYANSNSFFLTFSASTFGGVLVAGSNVSGTWIIDAYMRCRGAKIARLDREKPKRRALVNHKSNEPVTPIHERYRRVFRQLGLEAPDNFTRLYEGREWPVSPIVPVKEEGQRWIAISPFSSHRQKAYPLELMEQVIAQLCQHENYRIFLIGGGKPEKIALRPIARKYKNVISMAEVKHTFIDEYALLGKCDLMLTMESANMHLASLVDLQAMTIWGPTSPACGYLGYNQMVEDDIQLDMDCRPCSITGDKPCKYGDFPCLKNIKPETIAQHVIEAVEYNAEHQTKSTKLAMVRKAKRIEKETI